MLNGVINIYKERGYTSHDVVAKLRGILKQKKIGHTGTLDPDAEGVLPVCLGKATKLCDLLTDKDKTYEAVLYLGEETDTQDRSGNILAARSIEGITPEQAEEAIQAFVGDYLQTPPMYSALKVNGRKLYELARAGIEVERQARPVHIYEITVLEMSLPRIRMRIHCSKGTYIRTLCHDIGKKIGCGGCMEILLRTQVERFTLEDSHRLEEIRDIQTAERLLVPVDAMFAEYPAYTVGQAYEKWLYNGNPVQAEWADGIPAADTRCRIYDRQGQFVGLYRYSAEEKRFDPEKMFLA